MGLVFAVLKLLGGAAAFFVAWIGERGGHRLPFWAMLAVIAVGLALPLPHKHHVTITR
jgi:hypothetical protein